jgi:hypothetical protein
MMGSVRAKNGKGRVVVVALLPAILVIGILVAWQSGLFGRLCSAEEEGRVTDSPDGVRTAETAGEAAGAGAGASVTAVPREATERDASCPVSLSSDYRGLSYSRGAAIERWQGTSDLSCPDAARDLLLTLQGEGFELVKAGYLDLSGEAWGCTVKTEDGESLVVSLVPEVLGSARDEQNRLVLTVVRIGTPDIPEWTEGMS